jgi:hypothetical protein
MMPVGLIILRSAVRVRLPLPDFLYIFWAYASAPGCPWRSTLGEQNDITEQAAAQMWAHAVAVTFPHTHPARRLSLEALSLPQIPSRHPIRASARFFRREIAGSALAFSALADRAISSMVKSFMGSRAMPIRRSFMGTVQTDAPPSAARVAVFYRVCGSTCSAGQDRRCNRAL